MGIRGARYVHIHVPCPLGWGSAPEDTIKIARLAVESGLFPLFEASDGEVTATHADPPPGAGRPNTCKLQKRFAHLFGKPEARAIAIATASARRSRLMRRPRNIARRYGVRCDQA